MYAALDGREEAWVAPSAQKAAFNPRAAEERIAFQPVVVEKDSQPDADAVYPLTAIVGTQRYQLGSGIRTRASERIQAWEAAGQMEISPEDAAALGLEAGERLLVRSAFGAVRRPIRITSDVQQGQLFLPTGVDGNKAIQLFGPTPAGGWKSCAVNIEKA
jgi:anaerobic selenocysteine-containing dehydrogenase